MASGWFGSEICGLPVENERKGEEEMYTYNLTQWLAFFIIALSDGAGNPLLYL